MEKNIFIFGLAIRKSFKYFKLVFTKSFIFYKFNSSLITLIKTDMFFITIFIILS